MNAFNQLELYDFDFEDSRVSKLLGYTARVALMSPGERRHEIDSRIQEYIDSRNELLDWDIDNVEDAVEYLRNHATIKDLHRNDDKSNGEVHRIRRVRMGADAVQVVPPGDVPSPEAQWKLLDESVERSKLAATIYEAFDSKRINTPTAQSLLLLFKLSESTKPYTPDQERSMMMHIRDLYSYLRQEYQDIAQNDKQGKAAAYRNPQVDEGMGTIYSLLEITRTNFRPGTTPPIDIYLSSRVGTAKTEKARAARRAASIAAVNFTLRSVLAPSFDDSE